MKIKVALICLCFLLCSCSKDNGDILASESLNTPESIEAANTSENPEPITTPESVEPVNTPEDPEPVNTPENEEPISTPENVATESNTLFIDFSDAIIKNILSSDRKRMISILPIKSPGVMTLTWMARQIR